MKQFDIKSVLVGALLAVLITLSVAAVTGGRAAWEYKVIIGKGQDDLGNQDKLGQAINSSVAEGVCFGFRAEQWQLWTCCDATREEVKSRPSLERTGAGRPGRVDS